MVFQKKLDCLRTCRQHALNFRIALQNKNYEFSKVADYKPKVREAHFILVKPCQPRQYIKLCDFSLKVSVGTLPGQ